VSDERVVKKHRLYSKCDSPKNLVLTAALQPSPRLWLASCGAAMIGRLCNPALKLLTFFHGAEP
jgi:hypothetical protein